LRRHHCTHAIITHAITHTAALQEPDPSDRRVAPERCKAHPFWRQTQLARRTHSLWFLKSEQASQLAGANPSRLALRSKSV
jgi:hypothetical protein